MKDTYYHATPYENLASIVVDGIKSGMEGVVYLTKERDDAFKFLAIRGCHDILTVEVLIDSEKVEETFDHSLQFFKCKAFGYKGDIKPCEMIILQMPIVNYPDESLKIKTKPEQKFRSVVQTTN